MRTSAFLLTLFVFLIFSCVSVGAVIEVPGDYATIQDAIDASTHGDEIIVSPGTYSENIDFDGKNITLRSTDPTSATIVASTVIDGSTSGSVVTFSGTELSTCVLSGFTITNGKATNGGGIMGYGTLATIRYNSITTNTAHRWEMVGGFGGGLYECHGMVENNTIIGNSAHSGSGLFDCDGIIQSNVILGNSGNYRGGGLYRCDGTIEANNITSNSAVIGGGLMRCCGLITSNTISSNRAHSGGGLIDCDADTIQYNTIRDNVATYYYGGALARCNTVIQANSITGNSAVYGGGLFMCHDTIDDNTISSNSADYGGGLYDCQGDIQHNTIVGNTANLYGGGLEGCHGIIQDNLISNNLAERGGGIRYCGGTIKNNTISGNSAVYTGGGLRACDGTIEDNTIWGNSAAEFGGGLCRCDGIIASNVIAGNSSHSGGGLYGCDGTIHDNTISNNSASSGGGLARCQAKIQHNRVINNLAHFGGGLDSCSGIVEGNYISGNAAMTGRQSGGGGGLDNCDGIMQNNIISNNSSDNYGGGVGGCRGTFHNNTVYGNLAMVRGGGISCRYAIIRNCVIWQNTAPLGTQLTDYSSTPSYSCIQNWTGGGVGNINSDPQLVDPLAGDFHLLPNSGCIDAGGTVTLFQDFEGDPRPYDAVVWEIRGDGSDFDIGADEFIGTALPTPTPTPTPTPALLIEFDFEGDDQGWRYRQLSPTEIHISHWDQATSLATAHAIGISSPYDESTNYFGLWDSLEAEPIPYLEESLYEVNWLFSTNRETTNAAPSFRFRIGLNNQKAFSYVRAYPGEWLPLATQPESTSYTLFFEPPIAADSLFLAFSLIDWIDDFRDTSPAGEIYLEEVAVWRHELGWLEPWVMDEEWTPEDFDSWTTTTLPPYEAPECVCSPEGLLLSSGIHASEVFGCWDSPADLFTLEASKVYRLTPTVSASQLGGPELRLRVHTDDWRYAWYTHYIGSWTPGESALPPVEGMDYDLYLSLPVEQTQNARFSFDLIDFSSTMGGQLALHNLSLYSRLY